MVPDPIAFALQTRGHLWFPANCELGKRFESAGGRVVRQAAGHLVFYRSDGRRFLATDPSGHPLHECEWALNASGATVLTRARMRLDWDRWVGLKPSGLVNQTTLNLSTKPGWQRIRPDDLRAMAAQALRVPIEEVRWFYRDEDLSIDAKGMATIRHRKDAFYALEDGGFDRARFMSCMGAMHWDQIDFLPVVELFKSLLPGTGSAAFELIRGLYDDQNMTRSAPRPLHYRGIPTYPSEAAFRLFSSFFIPSASSGGSALTQFLDAAHAHEVTWLPAEDPPLRYFDPAQGLSLTVRHGVVQKATLAEDSTGLSYVNPTGRRVVPLDRSVQVCGDQLVLKDRNEEKRLSVTASGLSTQPAPQITPVSPLDWKTVFVQDVPAIPASEAYGAVLFYPDDSEEISELSAQPFVADYLQDVGEQDREIGGIVSGAERVLIENGDAVIATCIPFDRPRDYMVSIRHPAYAQRQAQQLWTQCAAVQRWEWLQRIRFVPAAGHPDNTTKSAPYDLVYQWIPYDWFKATSELQQLPGRLRQMIRPRGHAFVVGPSHLREMLLRQRFEICWEEPVEQLPTFRMHRTILPRAQVRPGLTLFHARPS